MSRLGGLMAAMALAVAGLATVAVGQSDAAPLVEDTPFPEQCTNDPHGDVVEDNPGEEVDYDNTVPHATAQVDANGDGDNTDKNDVDASTHGVNNHGAEVPETVPDQVTVNANGNSTTQTVPSQDVEGHTIGGGQAVPVLGGQDLVNDEEVCVEAFRTLVFQGTALIPNGVNWAGVGCDGVNNADSDNDGTADCIGGDVNASGGNYVYDGDCIMVDWEQVWGSAATVSVSADGASVGETRIVEVGTCDFAQATGPYHGPDGIGPIFDKTQCVEHGGLRDGTDDNEDGDALDPLPGDFIGVCSEIETQKSAVDSGLEGSSLPLIGGEGRGLSDDTGLDWEPYDQASCAASSGAGQASFKIKPSAGQLVDENLNKPQTWASDYEWKNTLNNLRGDVWLDADEDGVLDGNEQSFLFDAKIHSNADPRELLDQDTALLLSQPEREAMDLALLGCFEKTLTLASDFYGVEPLGKFTVDERTGLNDILIVGTASWKVEEIPRLFCCE